MFYEEKCQLGFNASNSNDFFLQYGGNGDSIDQEDYYGNEDYQNKGHRAKSEEKENNSFNNQNQDLQHLVSNAALKMNFDKKVNFADQLAFKIDHPPLFQGEEPIYFFKKLDKSKTKKGKKKKQSFSFIPPYLNKKRPTSAIKTKPKSINQEWNQDTRPSKYFDINIDPKAKKQFEKEERERNHRPQSVAKTSIAVQKNFEEGKIEVGFLKNNGQVGSKFEMYKDINALQDTKQQNYAATGYSIKKVLKEQSPPRKNLVSTLSTQKKQSQTKLNKDIFIAPQVQGFDMDSQQQQKLQIDYPQPPSFNLPQSQFLTQNGEIDVRMQQLISQTLQSKESVIQALEDELRKEKERRDNMSKQFKDQLKEFEDERDALERIRKASQNMEKKQQIQKNHKDIQEQKMEDELDMVPSKEKSTARTHISAKSFGNQSAKSAKGSKKSQPTYRSDRVKTSIPKATETVKKAIKKSESVKYLEELKQQELERAIKLQHDEQIQNELIKKLRDHPNEHLHDLQTEVALLNRKVEPLLKRVEEAAKNIQYAGDPLHKKQMPGPISMLSKMGGRLINFYSNDLAEMLLDDFLIETALELQNLEKNALKDYSNEEAKAVAENLLMNIIDYQNKESEMQLKWNNPALKNKNQKGGLSSLQYKEPKAITFNLDDEIEESKEENKLNQSIQKSNSKQQKYQNPFGRAIDPFSQKLAEISSSAPDVSYNMMSKLGDTSNKNKTKDLNEGIEIKGQKDANYEVKRKYKIVMPSETINNIVLYKEKYEKYLKMHNNTANKDVWKIYDHIAADIFHEVFQQSLKQVSADMEEYIEKVMYDEFQL